MKIRSIIFNNEIEFRQYILSNLESIDRIFVFEDSLDKIIYFYCFFNDGLITATKELSKDNFSFYNKVYNEINENLKLDVINEPKHQKVIKFKKSI